MVRSNRRAVRSLEVDIIHRHGITRNSAGRITFLHEDTRHAIYQPFVAAFRDADGSARVSRARLLFHESFTVGTSDELELPDGETAPILRISGGLGDPAGGSLYVEVLLG